jgi:hypothetical protein
MSSPRNEQLTLAQELALATPHSSPPRTPTSGRGSSLASISGNDRSPPTPILRGTPKQNPITPTNKVLDPLNDKENIDPSTAYYSPPPRPQKRQVRKTPAFVEAMASLDELDNFVELLSSGSYASEEIRRFLREDCDDFFVYDDAGHGYIAYDCDLDGLENAIEELSKRVMGFIDDV